MIQTIKIIEKTEFIFDNFVKRLTRKEFFENVDIYCLGILGKNEEGGFLKSVITFEINKESVNVFYIYTNKNFRRNGLATELILFLTKILQEDFVSISCYNEKYGLENIKSNFDFSKIKYLDIVSKTEILNNNLFSRLGFYKNKIIIGEKTVRYRKCFKKKFTIKNWLNYYKNKIINFLI